MIKVQNLTKFYGDVEAVSDLSFEIGDGHVYGFLGPNGAGKSTTMNIMTGCLSATGGTVSIDGHDIFEEPKLAKRLIGYLPEQPPLYLSETPEEYLRFVGEAKGLRGQRLREEIDSAVERTGISAVRGRRISALSKGYRQRVGIAQALLGNPRVIILDEPTVGLDPKQIIEIRDLIRTLGRDHTVIFSSHILSEVQTICDRIMIIAHGRLVAEGDPLELEQRLASGTQLLLTVDCDSQEAGAILSGLEGVSGLEASEDNGAATLRLSVTEDDSRAVARRVFFAFASAGKAILEMTLSKATLEDVFLELTQAPPAEDAPNDAPNETPDEAPNTAPAPGDTEPENNESEAVSDDSGTEA